MLAFIWVLIEPQKMKSQVMDNFVNFGPILGHLSLFGAETRQQLTKLKKNWIIYPRTQYLQKNFSSIGFEDSP